MQSHLTEKTEHNCVEKSFGNNRNKNYAMTYPPRKIPNIVLPEICSQLSIKSKQVLPCITNTDYCRLARNSITKTGRFLTSPSLNVLPVKSSFEARHLLTIHESRWNIFLMASYKNVFNGAKVKQWFQTTKQYQRISYHMSIQNNLRKEIYLIRNSLKTSDIVTYTNLD